jgi:aquaporin Z
VGGLALSQLWLFIIAPLLGGALAAVLGTYLFPEDVPAPETTAVEPVVAEPA